MTNRGRTMHMSKFKAILLAGAVAIAPAHAFAAPKKEAPKETLPNVPTPIETKKP